MAVYTNDLRLKEIATGDESGTWGTSTNTNLSLIADAFGFGTEAITTNADTHTTTIADGSADPGRSIFLKYTGTLDSACTITIGPNTVSKLWFIENATSGSQNIIIKQGSGATVTIANGQTKAIYSDGAGSGGAMVDAFQDLSIPDLFIDDDLTFTSDSAVITFGADGDTTLTHTDGSGLTLNSTNKLMFNDASQFIQGSSATVLSLGATDEIDLTATLIDINGNADVSGTVTATGTSVFASLDISGDIDVDGTTNLDVVDIDGAVDMASTLSVGDLTTLKTDGSGFALKIVENSGSEHYQIGTDSFGGLVFYNETTKVLALNDASGIDTFGNVIFNEDSADLDFRVESDNNANMLLVNGGNDRVGIGVDPGTAQFEVLSASNQIVAHFAHPSSSTSDNNGGAVVNVQNTNSTNGNMSSVIFRDSNNNASSGIFGYNSDHSDGEGLMTFGTRNSSGSFGERLRISSAGLVGIGTNSPTTALTVSTDGTEQLTINRADSSISTNNTVGTILFTGDDPSANQLGARIQVLAAANWTTNAFNSHITFSNDSSGTITERMRITSGGDAGLGGGANVNIGNFGRCFTIVDSAGSNQTVGLELAFATNTRGADLYVDNRASVKSFIMKAVASDLALQLGTDNTERFRIATDGAFVFSKGGVVNEDGGDFDFRVESDDNANMLVVDAGDNAVGIGTATITNPYSQTPHTDVNIDGTWGGVISFKLGGTLKGWIGQRASGNEDMVLAAASGQDLLFYTDGSNERMRIDSSGTVFVNTTAATGPGVIAVKSTATATGCLGLTNTNNGGSFIRFANAANNAVIGVIQNNNDSGTSYITTSDYRLKENVDYEFNALDRVAQLKPARFNFIADADTTVDGFLAHEVQDIVPQAVSGEKDAVDDEGNPDYQGIDHSKLVPLLTKAIQEQQALIEALQTKVAALEGGS